MGLETASYIWQLVPTNPEGIDPVSEGDNHIRMLKSTLQASFPDMSAPWVTTSPVGVGEPTADNHAVTKKYLDDNQPSTDPVGHPRIWLLPTLPGADYDDMKGQELDRTAYAELFALYGTKYGAGNGVTTFKMPDLRGTFMRVQDLGAGVDPDAALRTDRGDGTVGDNVGTLQADAFRSHLHSKAGSFAGVGGSGSGNFYNFNASSNTDNTGGNDTRPVNVYIRMICRAK